MNQKLKVKYKTISENERRFELYNLEKNPELVMAAFGTTARVCKSAIDELKTEGIEAGLFRPISLYPFPYPELEEVAERKFVKQFLCVEMSLGQMIEDVRLATHDKKPIHFYGRQGGIVPSPEEVVEQGKLYMKGGK